MSSRCLLGVSCALIILAGNLQAQDAPPRGGFGGGGTPGGRGGFAAGNPDDITTRTYSVADLLRPTGDYPLAGGGNNANLPGGAAPASPAAPARPVTAIEIDPLIKLLQNTIQPDSWVDNGGAIGRIGKLSSLLVITQTNQIHGEINQLLSDIRRNAGPTTAVTVRATWVQTDARQILTPTSEVNDEWMAKQKTYCESQITCFSGQIVYQTSGLDKSYVSDLTPIVGTNAVAFDPTIGNASSGVRMQIAPQLIRDGSDMAILDVQADVTEAAIQSPAAQIISFATGTGSTPTITNSTATVDRVNVLRQQFKTTTRLPLRKKIIIGGMTLEPASAEQGGRQLYLVVEIDTVK